MSTTVTIDKRIVSSLSQDECVSYLAKNDNWLKRKSEQSIGDIRAALVKQWTSQNKCAVCSKKVCQAYTKVDEKLFPSEDKYFEFMELGVCDPSKLITEYLCERHMMVDADVADIFQECGEKAVSI